MSDPQVVLRDRVLALLGERSDLREQRMFGARCLMLADRMLVAVDPGGGLLVRVDPEDGPDLQRRPGARQAEMGTGRSMGPSWISVDADAVATEDSLRSWLDAALAHHARHTAT